MNRHVIIRAFASIGQRGFKRSVDSVAFWRAGQVNNRLSNGAFTFRRANASKAIPGRNCHLHRSWISVTHIFRRYRQTATRDI